MTRLVEEIVDWLASLPGGQTIRERPETTIHPQPAAIDEAGKRALDLLTRLREGTEPENGITVGNTLGMGGTAVVHQATQAALGRNVAVKTLRPERRGEAATMAILREAWLTGSLEHPNIVPVYDIAVDGDGIPQIVLKRIEGVEWTRLISNPDFLRERFGAEDPLEWNLGIWLQVANAIRFAHSRHIIHRDIKPDNVMIGEFGEVYVLDWGLAVSLVDDGSGRLPLASRATEMAGTLSYMAPEMLGGEEHRLTERTDIYLLGGLLYHIAVGHPPHRGQNAMEVITSVVESNLAFPPESFPFALGDICRKAMATDPADRYASVEELRGAVQRVLHHRGSGRLADRAERKLAQLLARLGEIDVDVSKANADLHQYLYILFGQCRFGFREALGAWPENQEARRGLRRAVRAMVQYELDHGSAQAASRLMAELGDAPPADLRDAVERSLNRTAEREIKFDRLQARHDPAVGWRQRLRLGVFMGTMFTVSPLVAVATEVLFGVDRHTAYPWLLVAVLLGVAATVGAARTVVLSSALTRQTAAIALSVLAAGLVFLVGGWVADLQAPLIEQMLIGIWFTGALVMASVAEVRLAPAAGGYLAAMFIALAMPEQVLYVMAAANALLTANAALVWRRPPR